MLRSHTLRLAVLAATLAASAGAHAVPVVLTKLTGLTGDPAGAATAVYKGDLFAAGDVSFQAVSISDDSGGFGGSPGQFTGFDLDAIKLSTTNCADATCAAAAPGLALFDFVGDVVFAPGTQRAPFDAKLFGTGPGGNTVDDGVARLGLFDGVSSTVIPDGFLSLGDNGRMAFNLSAAATTPGLYLYIGEVGDNGEVAGSAFDLLPDRVTPVPEPQAYALMLAGLGVLGFMALRRKDH